MTHVEEERKPEKSIHLFFAIYCLQSLSTKKSDLSSSAEQMH